MDPESGRRASTAAGDLLEILRLAQRAAERLEHELTGAPYERNELLSAELHRLCGLAERLKRDAQEFARREAAAASARGHPLRRSGDRRQGAARQAN